MLFAGLVAPARDLSSRSIHLPRHPRLSVADRHANVASVARECEDRACGLAAVALTFSPARTADTGLAPGSTGSVGSRRTPEPPRRYTA